MYKFNPNLIFRDDEKSIFSLENMEIYQFNVTGFEAIKKMKDFSEPVSYEKWLVEVKEIPDMDSENIKEFWDSLIEKRIFIE